jgi:hypothetical protein
MTNISDRLPPLFEHTYSLDTWVTAIIPCNEHCQSTSCADLSAWRPTQSLSVAGFVGSFQLCLRHDE